VAEQNVKAPRRTRTGRLRAFNRARWMKTSRYAVSGLVLIIAGLVVLILGILLYTGGLTQAGFLIGGVGVIVVIVGIVRLLIGFINPASPEDLRPLEIQEEQTPDEDGEVADNGTVA
jgi:fatty acid desaturase